MRQKNYYDHDFDMDKPSEMIAIEKKLENAGAFFEELYRELSSDEPLDLGSIYHHMSEIAGYLNIDERQFGDLNIVRESKVLKFKGL